MNKSGIAGVFIGWGIMVGVILLPEKVFFALALGILVSGTTMFFYHIGSNLK